MGVTTVTEQHASPVPPARLFEAMFTDSQNVLPNAMPQLVKNTGLEGEKGVGSVSKTVFTEGSNLKTLKHRIDAFDSQNLTCKYTLIEGDILDDKLESVSYLVKFEPSGNGGSVIKTTTEYHTKDAGILYADNIAGKANVGAVYKAVEDHLLKTPSVCTREVSLFRV